MWDAMCTLLLSAALGQEQAAPEASIQPPLASVSPSAMPPEGQRQREGTALRAQLGQFKFAGDRLTFQTADSARRYIVLENLCLERVVRLLSDKGGNLTWSVDGTITEFRGANYLLLSRATVRMDSAK